MMVSEKQAALVKDVRIAKLEALVKEAADVREMHLVHQEDLQKVVDDANELSAELDERLHAASRIAGTCIEQLLAAMKHPIANTLHGLVREACRRLHTEPVPTQAAHELSQGGVVLNVGQVTDLAAWAEEENKPHGCSGWGPRFTAAFEVARTLRDRKSC